LVHTGYCCYATKHSTLGRSKLVTERGHAFSVIKDGQTVRGRLIGSTQFASGRFVMIDDGFGFSPVPWRPVKGDGREVIGTVRGTDVSRATRPKARA
jgi:hypothetical protein